MAHSRAFQNHFFLIVFSALAALGCGNVWNLPLNESAAIGLFIYFLVKIIKNLGRTVWVFVDVISLLLVLTCLVTPLFFYHYFTDSSALAVLWVKFMPVTADVYYSYTLPASLSLIAGFNIPIIGRKELKHTIKTYIAIGQLRRPAKLGLQLILISLLALFFKSFAPSSLGFVLFLLIKLIFVGFLYIYFSDKKPNIKWIAIAGILLLVQSLQSAMFGELIFMTLLAVIIFTYGKRYNILLKTGVLAVGLIGILIIQSVKHEYRQTVWGNSSGGTGANIALFATLAGQNIQGESGVFSEEKLFFTAIRFNQGWLVASVMKNVPSRVPFAGGETIWQSLLASVAPRFLWPNKPEAGGKANIKRFLGWDLRGTSMNIGLLGEAYANFNAWGGCLFLFCYGLAFQWAYNVVIRLTHRFPTLILWIPLLFYYCIGVENDVLTVVNHLTKTSFFVYVLFKIYPRLSNIRL